MIRICMITHDRLERTDPRADLIRFRNLGEALSKASADVVLISSNGRWRWEEGSYKGSKVYKIPLFSKSNLIQLIFFYLYLLPVLFRAKQSAKFDIIFVNSVFTVPAAWILKKLSEDACIQFDLMGILSQEKFIRSRKNFWRLNVKKVLSSMENFFWSHVDFITTINNQHRHLVLQRVRKPVYVVRDAVFESTLKNGMGVAKDFLYDFKTILIFVGQINYFRLDPLFRILPRLIAEVPQLQLHVLGTGPHLSRYRQMVSNLGLKEHVTFLGQVPHERIFDYIGRADIAYSDDWSVNGFPMKIFEYMAMGKPVVAESTVGIQELLIDDTNALLYRNERELKEKIVALAQDARLRKEIGENGKKTLREHTWENRVEALASIYEKYLRKE
ncbi:MAG: glycosyltransferase family 4 protein [Thermodesulfobacteriota bacterium]